MANYALLIGTKNGKRQIISDGNPVEIRRQFKDVTAKAGFELVEVVQKDVGLTRKRKFVVKPAAKKPARKK